MKLWKNDSLKKKTVFLRNFIKIRDYLTHVVENLNDERWVRLYEAFLKFINENSMIHHFQDSLDTYPHETTQ